MTANIHKKIRPHNYFHVKTIMKGNKKATWYWAIKRNSTFRGFPIYRRVLKDGDPYIAEKIDKNGNIVCTQELIIDNPIEERRAVMNLHYAELEEE